MCKHCGMMGYFDANRGMAVCPSTKSPEHMARLKLPYACKLLFQVLLPMPGAPGDCSPQHLFGTRPMHPVHAHVLARWEHRREYLLIDCHSAVHRSCSR